MQGQESILVVGADGQIGRSLAERWSAEGCPVVRTVLCPMPGAEVLDLSRDVSDWGPPCPIAVAYLCAAVTSLETCRSRVDETRRINVTATVTLARTLRDRGALVVFPSSNLVFDGSVPFQKADAPLCPRTEYGRQKAEVERQLLGTPGVCVVRLTKVLGPTAPFLLSWRHHFQYGRPIHPFSDMVMAPVPMGLAVEALRLVGQLRLQGVVQVSASEDVTYEQAARHVARRSGAADELVQPVKAADSGLTIEHVPAHTTLDSSRLCNELGLTPPEPWAALDVGTTA